MTVETMEMTVMVVAVQTLEREITALQPAVREVERQRDSLLLRATGEEASRLRDLTSQLTTQWTSLNAAFTDRQQ